jgi:hypothetical protein
MTGNIDLLDAELKVAQTECDDIDTAIAQIAADDADAKAKFIELSERRKIAGERRSRISTALTEARSGSVRLQHAADGSGGDTDPTTAGGRGGLRSRAQTGGADLKLAGSARWVFLLPVPDAAICWFSLSGPCSRDVTGGTGRENRAAHRCSHLL